MGQRLPLNVQYVIIDDEDLDAEAQIDGQSIGYAWSTRTDDRLQLCDIHVDGGFRGHGIGGGLLRFVLATATAAGIHEVWGIVTNDDLAPWPGLANWYAQNGFGLQPATDSDRRTLPNAVHRISRLLR